MKPLWLVQSNLISNDQLVPTFNALKEIDADVRDFAVIPFGDMELPITEKESEERAVIFLCSVNAVRRLMHTHHSRHLFFDKNKFKCSYWNEVNSDYMLNTMPEQFCCIGDLSKYIGHRHVRPNSDLKDFPGNVYSYEDLMGVVTMEDVHESTEVVVSPMRVLTEEYRTFVINGNCIQTRKYKQNGYLSIDTYVPKEILKLIIDTVQSVNLPHKNVVVDTTVLPETGELKIIEFNCLNCSGSYQHNLKHIFALLEETVENDHAAR